MKYYRKLLLPLAIVSLLAALPSGCAHGSSQTTDLSICINGRAVAFAEEGNTDLDLLSVENGITVQVETTGDEQVSVNGEVVDGSLTLDVTAITRGTTLEIEVADGDEVTSHSVNLMPSTFLDYTTQGESVTAGDYYLSTYDESVNYIFKLNNQGDLIFYKKTGGNALDFRKEYNSAGEVRYTYMPYLETSFCGIEGINPGCVVVMDEDYNVIDELYYQTADGEDLMIDAHGFIYLDDGHYILTAYEDVVVDNLPEDLGATDNSVYLAVLYIQEIKDGEVLWEFCSQDHTEFLYTSTEIDWSASTEECYDYVHFNSMFIDNDDNLLVSCRNINSIIKISREDGSLIWTLGGEQDDFGLTAEQIFSKQHSIIVTADGSYMLFNNANDEVAAGTASSSSVIRLKVDETAMKVTEYREVESGFYSNYMGAIRELDAEDGIYLWSVGGNYTGTICDYSMVEYSETDGAIFKFRFEDGYRKLYCANKCE